MTAIDDRASDTTNPGHQVVELRKPAAVTRWPDLAATRPKLPPLLVARRRAVQVVTTLGSSSTAATCWRCGRRAVVEVLVVGRGCGSWAQRAADAATHHHLREQIRLARVEGSREALAEWSERLESAKDARLARIRALPDAAKSVAVVAGVALGLALALLLAGGLVSQLLPGGGDWSSWWATAGMVVEVASTVATLAAGLVLWLALPGLAWAAWREGRRAGGPPLWLLTPEERAALDAEITPSRVVVALRDLGVATLRAAILEMDDGAAHMLSPIVIAGCGVEVDATLPSGVSTDQVQSRRRRLAENLDRHEHELHITMATAARTVRLWIANRGALDEPIGPSPLVTDPAVRASVRTGRAPWGENLRGEPVAISLWQRHVLVTGLSNQGKTAALRALALWAAFDIAAEFRIADLKGFRDWRMFEGLATVFICGPADEHVIAATHMVEEGVAEMKRRLQSGREDWPTLVLIVDEAQVAYTSPVVGDDKRPYGGKKNTSRYFMAVREIQNQGRAVNVLMWQGTQDPTDQNLPKLIREAAHIRASLVLGTESQARMALGDKAIDGGAAPHLLRQGLDKGTLVVAGDGVDLPPGDASLTIRTHFVDTEPAWEVARRAIERRRKAGRTVRVVDSGAVAVVDHLADIHEAMRGEQRVRTVVLLGRLIEENAAVYEPWGSDDLAEALRKYRHLGVDIRKSSGQSVVRLDEVSQALRERE